MVDQYTLTSNFSPESLPHLGLWFYFNNYIRAKYLILSLCEKVEFESEQMLAFSNLL